MKLAESPRLCPTNPPHSAAPAQSRETETEPRAACSAGQRFTLGFALCVTSLAAAPRAGAQVAEVPLELTWDAPAECPALPKVRAEVQRSLRARPDRSLPNVRVDARVVRSGSQYRVAVELTRGNETTHREFQSESCEALVRATTLSIALAFGDGETVSEEAAPAPDQEASPPTPTAAKPPPPPLPRKTSIETQAHTTAAPRWLALGVGAAWSPEALGGAAFGLHALAALRTQHAALGWINRVWLPHTVHVNDGASARFWAATTSLGPGLRRSFSWFEVELALAFQAGLIHGAGISIREPREAVAPWYAVVPSLTVYLRLGRGLRLALSEEVALTIDRARFDIAPLGDVYRAAPLIPVTTLSLPLDTVSF